MTRTKKHLFPLEYYDKDFCLKVNFFTMAVMFICCKSILVSVTAIMTKRATATIIQFFFFSQATMFASWIATIPTLLVLIAWARRHSGASKIIRALWHYGKFLLLSSNIMNLAIDIYSMNNKPWVTGTDLCLLYFDGLCLLYILNYRLYHLYN